MVDTVWPKPFGLGFFGAGIVFKVAFRFITKGYLAARSDLDIARVEMFHHVLLVMLCIYVLLMVRAMIKAGFDGRRPGVWGWMGIGLTVFVAVVNINIASKTFFPSSPTPRFMLEMEMRQVNKQLPQDFGNGMTMTRAEISGDDVIYYFDAEGEIDAVVNNVMEKSSGICKRISKRV